MIAPMAASLIAPMESLLMQSAASSFLFLVASLILKAITEKGELQKREKDIIT